MIKLINKGGFRERANRSEKYKHSENQQTVLNPIQYVPNKNDTEKMPINILPENEDHQAKE